MSYIVEFFSHYIVVIIIVGTLLVFYISFTSAKEWLRQTFSSRNTEEKLINSIIRRMNNDGYKCQKVEGVLTYWLNGRVYRTYITKTGANNFRMEVVDYLTIDDWDKISYEGKSVLANYVNSNCQYTTFVSSDNGVMCSFVAAINSSSDFMEQAKISYKIIGESLETANSILPQIKNNYTIKKQENHIGFNINRNK